MRADFALLLLDALPAARPVLAAETRGDLPMRKDAAEQAEPRRNAAITDSAMEAVFAALRPGLTEAEVVTIAVSAFKEHGAAPLFTIVGAGPTYTITPATPCSGQAMRSCSISARGRPTSPCITRTAVLGELPEDYARAHATVKAALQAALAAARPGVPPAR